MQRECTYDHMFCLQTLSVDPCRSVDAGASLDDAISVAGRGGLGRLAKGDMEVARSFANEKTEGRAWLGLGLGLGWGEG